MNKKQKLLLTSFALVMALLLGWTYTYDIATPAGSDDPAEADDRMREIKAALQERLNVEHVFDLTGTEVSHVDTGKHTDITTTSITNAGALANTGDFAVNTNKFTVAAASGNTVVAGTLDVTGTLDVAGASEVTGVATLGDGSLLKTSAAPTTDAMIANKKYVDDQNVSHVGQIKAWVKFDGTNADPDSTKIGYNVSSITDNGTGDYTINWTIAFASANYCAVATCSRAAGASEWTVSLQGINSAWVRIETYDASTKADSSIICVIAIGSQ